MLGLNQWLTLTGRHSPSGGDQQMGDGQNPGRSYKQTLHVIMGSTCLLRHETARRANRIKVSSRNVGNSPDVYRKTSTDLCIGLRRRLLRAKPRRWL